MSTNRKLLPQVPFHRFVLSELAHLLTIRQTRDARMRAVRLAATIRRVEIPQEHRAEVLESLQLVAEHFGGVMHSRTIPQQFRAEFYGAFDALNGKRAKSDGAGASHAQGNGADRHGMPADMPPPQHRAEGERRTA